MRCHTKSEQNKFYSLLGLYTFCVGYYTPFVSDDCETTCCHFSFLSKDSTSTKNQIYHLSITFPQFKGQLHFWKLQFEALCCSRLACLHFSPQSQIISLMGHALSWAGWVLRFNVWLHWRQTTSISPHFSTCSLAVSSCTLSLQARQSPWTFVSICVTKIFRQNSGTIWRHSGQGTGLDLPLRWSTHLPQNVWPHGVAIWASRRGFLLPRKVLQLTSGHNVFALQIKRIFTNINCLLLFIYPLMDKL